MSYSQSDLPHAAALRRGRVSEAGRIHLVTIACFERRRYFTDFGNARCVGAGMRARAVTACAETLTFVIMPDHVHWLLQLKDGADLGKVVRQLKAGVSVKAGKKVWQRGFHDHALRRDEDVVKLARYVIGNPVRAGLVEHVGDYPHWDAIWLSDGNAL